MAGAQQTYVEDHFCLEEFKALAMERKRQPGSAGRKTSYVAGGEHQGIVINKVPQEAEIIRV